jgi:DNA-binding transcriptional MocR family regulator
MMAALERHFPQGARWRRPSGGLFCWVKLPRGFDVRGLFVAAEARGVRFGSGELFHTAGNGGHTMRLAYSTATPSEIEEGIEILGELIRERWPSTERPVGPSPAASMPIV